MCIRDRCLTNPSGTCAQEANIRHVPPLFHRVDTNGGFNSADQNGGAVVFFSADEIEAPVNAVRAVNVYRFRRPEHDRVAFGRATKTVGGRIGLVVGFRFDDDTPDATVRKKRRCV